MSFQTHDYRWPAVRLYPGSVGARGLHGRVFALVAAGFCATTVALGCDTVADDDTAIDPAIEAIVDSLDQTFPHHRVPLVGADQIAALQIDGRLDEALWGELPTLDLSPFGDASERRTTARIAYSEEALVIGIFLEDEHIWSTLDDRDADLWTEEVIEIFLAPQGAEGSYVELQVNALGTIFDAHFDEPLGESPHRRRAIDAGRAWDLEGLTIGVHVDGRLNDVDHTDEFWSVEILIPWDGLPFDEVALPPQPGQVWRANLFRFDRPADGSRLAYGWSTALRGDFHQPQRFGYWIYSGP